MGEARRKKKLNPLLGKNFLVCEMTRSQLNKASKPPKFSEVLIIRGILESQWYVHFLHLPGGFHTLIYEQYQVIEYEDQLYVRLIDIERERSQRYDNIRAIALSALKKNQLL